jgi:hypothetical protein
MAARTRRTLAIFAVALISLVCAMDGTSHALAGSPIAYADPNGTCASLTPCYTTVQAAVNHVGGPGDGDVRIFPGTYNESVDLALMASEFNHVTAKITLSTVDVSGSPVKHTATIHGANPIVAEAFEHSVVLEGLVLEATSGDGANIETTNGPLIVRDSTANDAAGRGFVLQITQGSEDITVEHSLASGAQGTNAAGVDIQGLGLVTVNDVEADNNHERGIFVESAGTAAINDVGANGNGAGSPFGDGVAVKTANGNANITNVGSANNGDDGLDIEAGGEIIIDGPSSFANNHDSGADLTAAGFTIKNSDASGNGGIGWEIHGAASPTAAGEARPAGSPGLVIASNIQAAGNGADGINVTTPATVSIDQATLSVNAGNGVVIENASIATVTNSLIVGNVADGVSLQNVAAGAHTAVENVICSNTNAGLDLNADGSSLDAEGNWWGDVSGPTHPSNPSGTGDKVVDGENGDKGTADFTQWITQIEPTQLAEPAAIVGQNNAIVFVFSTEDRHRQFEDGPGSDVVSLPFSLSTDNGVLTYGNASASTVSARIKDSQLRVGLVAAHPGHATVTMTGPCGLHGEITVEVGGGAIKGDLNCSGGIDLEDLMRSLRYTSELPIGDINECPYSTLTLDLNCNGITSADGVDPLLIVLYLANVAPAFQLPQDCGPVGQ